MTHISVSELKNNTGKFVMMANSQDIIITKNGKVVAKLVSAKADKNEAFNHLTRLFSGVSITDADVAKAREERLH